MAYDKNTVRKLLEQAKAAGSSALTAPEAKTLCEAYGIAVQESPRSLGSFLGGSNVALVRKSEQPR